MIYNLLVFITLTYTSLYLGKCLSSVWVVLQIQLYIHRVPGIKYRNGHLFRDPNVEHIRSHDCIPAKKKRFSKIVHGKMITLQSTGLSK